MGRLVNGERKITKPIPEHAGKLLIFCEGSTEYNYMDYFKKYLENNKSVPDIAVVWSKPDEPLIFCAVLSSEIIEIFRILCYSINVLVILPLIEKYGNTGTLYFPAGGTENVRRSRN